MANDDEIKEAIRLLLDNGYQVTKADAEIIPVNFDAFWEAYDKKVGKDKCMKLWSKLSKGEQEKAIAYCQAYKQAQPEKRYRKNPETYLRNHSWNDELINYNEDERRQQQERNKADDILFG